MAMTNQERVGKALELLRQGLAPWVERECQRKYGKYWVTKVSEHWKNELNWVSPDTPALDAAVLLRVMSEQWNDVFRDTLGHAERSLVSEIRTWRNKWAHQEPISSDDADRALDSIQRLLTAISAPEADEVERMKLELRRAMFDQQLRAEKRRAGGSLIEPAAASSLRPWREIVVPHPDVASGRYQQAEFAADLWQVHLGEGADEYRDPEEFFRRTYLTESLRRLLVGAVQRLSGTGGDPVVQLQTNFGGGKTHSMLALYHLFSGANPASLSGVDGVMAEAGVTNLPAVRRVVLVGNKISPGNPATKPDGTRVHTLWGELAWQLGGREAYERIRADDERATNPGDVLRELFREYGPCLVLIDEWVAYARQLHDEGDLPAGSFETQFTFAQALTEAAKLAGNCLLVVSLPASDTQGSPHTQADDVEVGGTRGREALERLRNVIGRLESSWRPASAEEGFEIVRRRLFQPIDDPEKFTQRDLTARAFADLYRASTAEFPPECREADYEKRIRAAFPIHPEVFDRLYTDWSTLLKFQRTRGVLRLMAAVIHSLWEKGDRSPLILPSTIPIDDPRVQFELTRYLSDNWVPIIGKDVDGPNSTPARIDAEVTNLGKYAATRRVARTIYLGSAPTAATAHRGIEDRRVKLGCVMPGEPPAVFGDALRRLAAAATHLYQDGARFWYSTQPTVTRLAEERAEQLTREPDRVAEELERRVRDDLRDRGEFPRVHPFPRSSADVPDEREAGLVVLPADYSHTKDGESQAILAARGILETRGNAPRLFRNTLLFLAADKVRLQDLDEAVRRYLAWKSILDEKETLNLEPLQVRQAEAQLKAADETVRARLPETFCWLLVPEQKRPDAPVEWRAVRLSGSEALAARAGRKARAEELLLGSLGGTMLRTWLDRVPLWRGDHVSLRQLADDFASYLYLPRLKGPAVLANAVAGGIALLTWANDTFAYAESFDEASGRYRGLQFGQVISLPPDAAGLVVRPEVARRQIDAEQGSATTGHTGIDVGGGSSTGGSGGTGSGVYPQPAPETYRRFHGTIELDTEKLPAHAGQVNAEVIAHFLARLGAKVRVTLDIEATLPDGADEHLRRAVEENCRTLKFSSFGFERD